ncbi:MAG: hypothetical protein WHS89_08500 [Acidimicrobiales bacterium]|jgi:hypothetical protein
MTSSTSPLAVGLVAAGLAAVVVFVVVAVLRARRDRRRSGELKLPRGAEAALWSIVEVVPDPRNHLALTRDLSGEVRITDRDRALAAAAASGGVDTRSPVIDADPVVDKPVVDKPVIELRDGPNGSNSSSDADGDSRTSASGADPGTGDDLELTAQLFFAEQPRLSRF